MTKRIVPSWQKRKRHNHSRPRESKRPSVAPPPRARLALMLWSANGDPITTFHVGPSSPPSHIDFGGLRYELVGSPDRGNKVAHYQTGTIVPKAVA